MKFHYRITKIVAESIDQLFGSSIKEGGGRVYRYSLKILSPIRRVADPFLIKLLYNFRITKQKNLKIHLGCGWKHFPGYINTDLWITDATDVITDITRLPWPDNSATVIECYHVIEHISHTKIIATLKEWQRVLMPEGKLILECPHFDIAVKEYLDGNEQRLLNIFGRQRSDGDAHLYGYNPQRLECLLIEAGFKNIQERMPQSSQILDEPAFRMECQK